MKSLWMTSVARDQEMIAGLMKAFKTYGIHVQGHFWSNDNAKMAWLGAKAELLNRQVAVWAILAGRGDLMQGDVRYGLSMLALTVEAQRKGDIAIVILQTDGDPVNSDELPTLLRHAVVLPAVAAGTPAKLVAKVHAGAVRLPTAYYLDMVGNEQIGQWLEVRPTRDYWPGVIFGVDAGEILFQAVGPSGRLPQKSVLNYAMQGLRLAMGDTVFTAWAARNPVSADNAYYVKISGTPKTLVFGAYAEDSETDLYVVRLQ